MKNLHQISKNKCECDYPSFEGNHIHSATYEKRIRDGKILLLCDNCFLSGDKKIND